MTQDDISLQDDQAWFDALNGKSDSAQAARLRQLLREAELADAAQEDISHDWQRLQFALRREKAKPENKGIWQSKYYSIAASVFIVVCASSVIFETIKDPEYSSSASAPVEIPLPPPVDDAPPAKVTPPAAARHGITRHSKVNAAPKLDERESVLLGARSLISQQADRKIRRERPTSVEGSDYPRSMIAPRLPYLVVPNPPEPEVIYRSVEALSPPPPHVNRVDVVSTVTPEQDADRVKAELTQLGVGVVKDIQENKFVLIITLTYPVKEEVRTVLEAHHIPVPEQGELSVVFIKSSK